MKIALVVQRCGHEVAGGAESLCLELAGRLQPHAEVEILTTCAIDYVTWKNHYPPGVTKLLPGVTVRRFPVDRPRQPRIFGLYSRYLMLRQRAGRLKEWEQRLWMWLQGPISRAFLRHLRQHGESYDHIIFFTYLYATTVFGLPIVASRAWLVPTAHDEWPIYLSLFEHIFALPQGIFYLTRSEQEFVRRRFPRLDVLEEVVGAGIDTSLPPGNVAAFREATGIAGPFLLYLGRIDGNKGCQELFDFFIHFRLKTATPLTLVLCGKAVMDIPRHPDIVHLGFVDDAIKRNALAACDWLINPSSFESLSLVLLEAWREGRPVVVNRSCQVTADQVAESGGGKCYEDYASFERILRDIDDKSKSDMGQLGRAYVLRVCSWGSVLSRYLKHLSTNRQSEGPSRRSH